MTVALSNIACAECGTGFTPRQRTARFCCTPCKTRFNNRRFTRGAAIYDLTMAKRYDRVNEAEARSLLDNLARAFRDADKAAREGRPSWVPFEDAKATVPLAFGMGGDGR